MVITNDVKEAFYIAIDNDDLETVKSLIEDPEIKFVQAVLKTGLDAAVSMGHGEITGFLLDNGAQWHILTPQFATWGESELVFEHLRRHGWSTRKRDSDGGPYLRFATRNEKILKWFLEHGANAKVHGNERCPAALTNAAWYGNLASVKLLVQYGAKLADSDALHAAVLGKGDIPMMAYLLDQGYPINNLQRQNFPKYRARRGGTRRFRTALHLAIAWKKADMVRFLIDRGADLRVKDSNNRTPLALARHLKHEEFYSILGGDAEGLPIVVEASAEAKPLRRSQRLKERAS